MYIAETMGVYLGLFFKDYVKIDHSLSLPFIFS